jgi:hypothetical protein
VSFLVPSKGFPATQPPVQLREVRCRGPWFWQNWARLGLGYLGHTHFAHYRFDYNIAKMASFK